MHLQMREAFGTCQRLLREISAQRQIRAEPYDRLGQTRTIVHRKNKPIRSVVHYSTYTLRVACYDRHSLTECIIDNPRLLQLSIGQKNGVVLANDREKSIPILNRFVNANTNSTPMIF